MKVQEYGVWAKHNQEDYPLKEYQLLPNDIFKGPGRVTISNNGKKAFSIDFLAIGKIIMLSFPCEDQLQLSIEDTHISKYIAEFYI